MCGAVVAAGFAGTLPRVRSRAGVASVTADLTSVWLRFAAPGATSCDRARARRRPAAPRPPTVDTSQIAAAETGLMGKLARAGSAIAAVEAVMELVERFVSPAVPSLRQRAPEMVAAGYTCADDFRRMTKADLYELDKQLHLQVPPADREKMLVHFK
eukprot:gene49525-66995_t